LRYIIKFTSTTCVFVQYIVNIFKYLFKHVLFSIIRLGYSIYANVVIRESYTKKIQHKII
jgi:hypothetical protein